jgi:hypothetical protein
MSAQHYKKLTVESGILNPVDSITMKCNVCGKTANYKISCGNNVKYACSEHQEQTKIAMTNDMDVDCAVLSCSQGGPHPAYNRTILNHPAA